MKLLTQTPPSRYEANWRQLPLIKIELTRDLATGKRKLARSSDINVADERYEHAEWLDRNETEAAIEREHANGATCGSSFCDRADCLSDAFEAQGEEFARDYDRDLRALDEIYDRAHANGATCPGGQCGGDACITAAYEAKGYVFDPYGPSKAVVEQDRRERRNHEGKTDRGMSL